MQTQPFNAADRAALAQALSAAIAGEVRFDAGSRALYATDASNYRQPPLGVVIPRTLDDVIAVHRICHERGAPVLSRGGGTSLAGQCCNVAVVMDLSKYLNRIVELDPAAKIARVEPGVVLDDLRDAAEAHGLTFAPDPATHDHNTIGGMIGNNSCGVHSVMGGRTSDNIIALDVLTYDGTRMTVGATGDDELAAIAAADGPRGEIYARLKALRDRYADAIRERYPDIPRRVSGYNLDDLLPEKGFQVARALVGTEGTCVTVLGATVRLIDSPPVRSLLVLGYPDLFTAGDQVGTINRYGPLALEGMGHRLVERMRYADIGPDTIRLLPEGQGWLMAEFGGRTRAEADAQARRLMEALAREPQPPSMKLFENAAEAAKIWTIRKAALGAATRIAGRLPTWEGWEDSAVAPEKIGVYLRDLRKLLDKYGYHCEFYGHFGQGCVHNRIDFDLESAAGIRTFRAFMEEAADLVVAYKGSLSGEHGDGQARGELLERMYGAELMTAFREFKSIWDPHWKMNPGKVIGADAMDTNLRLGADFKLPVLDTHFKFPDDDGSFAKATLRCVGVGNCRNAAGGTMCPSWRATHDENDVTRGRAHMLFEMLRGDVVTRGWREDAVKRALDLCLSCKGCKHDCPVNVDMATYKAEFLAHYYAGRVRPLNAYAFGLIDRVSRVAAVMPGVVNAVTQTPGVRDIARAMLGMPAGRQFPRYAQQTFKTWFKRRLAPRSAGAPPVILWADTFNNHFHPDTTRAGLAVLESAGFDVRVPLAPLCCGRPLYEFGMLGRAKNYLERIMTELGDDIDAGVPIVGLEPSCMSVFRDELLNLFPDNDRARKLAANSYILSEFLESNAPDYRPPRLAGAALVQAHCHHTSILRTDAEKKLLKATGLDCDWLDGCCGMAGPFGFEREKYAISMQIGERELLPKVRAAGADTLIVANGFSCREQIAQATGRRPLHIAEVMRLANAGRD